MITDEEKAKIKKDIVEKVNSVLEKNNESFRMDNVNVLNKSETVKFMGNYRVYDRKNYNAVSREINAFLKGYGNVDIKSKKIRDSGMKFTAVSFNFELWLWVKIEFGSWKPLRYCEYQKLVISLFSYLGNMTCFVSSSWIHFYSYNFCSN